VKHWLIIAAALALTPFAAHPEDAGPRIEQAWARATPGSATTGAAYLTIEASEPDRLVGASTPVAGRAELHAHENDHGVMRMHPVDGVAVQPGAPTVLKPGGVHVMLMQLKHPLKVGDTFPLTLRFAKAGDREVTVHVEKPGAAGPRQGS
jgi:copper(I)-binding protein